MNARLFLLLLALGARLLPAQPAPPVLDILSLDSASVSLQWTPVGAACYEVRQSRDGGDYRFLGRTGGTQATLGQAFAPWGDPQTRLYQVVALDACPPVVAPPTDLLAWWPLDGDGNDVTGHGWNLTPYNVTWVAGHQGQAAELNGVNAFLERGSASSLNPGSGGWTVSAWVQAAGAPLQGAVVDWYRCGANPGCSSVDPSLYILSMAGDRPAWNLRDQAGLDISLMDGPFLDQNWHLLTGTLSESDHQSRLYVDGSLIATGTGIFQQIVPGGVTIPLSVGRHFRQGWASPILYLNGRVDDVRIYGRGLNADEVLALYQENGWPLAMR